MSLSTSAIDHHVSAAACRTSQKKLSCMCAAFGAQSPRSCHLTPVIMADRYGMDSSFNPDLLCVELCRHGITCKRRKAGSCGYAHALQELRPPDESRRGYGGVWKDGVDRFYGQRMTETQIERVMWYYERTRESDRPMWSHALRWYITREDLHSELPADFGIEQDWKSVSMFRKPTARPFCWAAGFWKSISKRRQILKEDKRSCPQVSRRPRTPPVVRRGTKDCLPLYAKLLPQEEKYASRSVAKTEGVSRTSSRQDSANVNPVCEKSLAEGETSMYQEEKSCYTEKAMWIPTTPCCPTSSMGIGCSQTTSPEPFSVSCGSRNVSGMQGTSARSSPARKRIRPSSSCSGTYGQS